MQVTATVVTEQDIINLAIKMGKKSYIRNARWRYDYIKRRLAKPKVQKLLKQGYSLEAAINKAKVDSKVKR